MLWPDTGKATVEFDDGAQRSDEHVEKRLMIRPADSSDADEL
jgi:hypothetical protein